MNNSKTLQQMYKGDGYTLWTYPWNAFNTRYDSEEYLKWREDKRWSFMQRIHSRPYIDEYSIYRYKAYIDTVSMWEDAVDRIDQIINPDNEVTLNSCTIETYKPLNYPSTILMRGNYSMGRNTFLKQMGMYDPGAMLCSIDGFKVDHSHYQFSVFPMFGVIMTGFFTEDNPFNANDKWYHNEYTIQDHMNILEFIHKHPDFKKYNVIIDGNVFQPYLNRSKNLIKSIDYKRKYIDLYILNKSLYHYLTDAITMCHYKKYGWNKYPTPSAEYCTLFDNLEGASKEGIMSYYIPYDSNPDTVLYKLLTGEMIQIEHYKNKPIIP